MEDQDGIPEMDKLEVEAHLLVEDLPLGDHLDSLAEVDLRLGTVQEEEVMAHPVAEELPRSALMETPGTTSGSSTAWAWQHCDSLPLQDVRTCALVASDGF